MGRLKGVLEGAFSYGDITNNVMYWQGNDALVANRQVIADAVRAILLPAVSAWSTAYSFTGMTFYNLDNPGTPGVATQFTSGPLVGTNGGELLPGQIAALIGFKANTTRPNRKRLYIAGSTETYVSNGLWISSFITTLTTVANKLLDFETYSGLDTSFCTVWQTSEGLVSANDLEIAQVFQVPATQRRRRRGQGV